MTFSHEILSGPHFFKKIQPTNALTEGIGLVLKTDLRVIVDIKQAFSLTLLNLVVAVVGDQKSDRGQLNEILMRNQWSKDNNVHYPVYTNEG